MRRVYASIAATVLLIPRLVFAQGNNGGFVPLADYSGSRLQQSFGSPDLSSYLNSLFQLSLSVGAILAVVMLVYGGYLYMGSDMWATKQRAKQVITDAVIGLLVLLGIYLILYQINPCILSLHIGGGLNIGTSNSACQ
jgi:hypothetical protein